VTGRPLVMSRIAPGIYPGVIERQDQLRELLCEGIHACIGVFGVSVPLPPEPLDSHRAEHAPVVDQVARQIYEEGLANGLRPSVIGGTMYADAESLARAPVDPVSAAAQLAARDQALAGLRDGTHTGVLIAYVYSLRIPRRSAA
jgi:hypothetical protein